MRPFTDKATEALKAALDAKNAVTSCKMDKKSVDQCAEGTSVLADYLFAKWLESRGLILKRAVGRPAAGFRLRPAIFVLLIQIHGKYNV